jgi:hypothetical protein
MYGYVLRATPKKPAQQFLRYMSTLRMLAMKNQLMPV